MRKFIPLILLLVVFSCREISYKETQPLGRRSLSKIPKALQGSFVISDTKDNSTDTLVISARGYFVVSDNKRKSLGDSLNLKSYKGYYFVNVNENPEWLLRVIKVESNGDLTLMSMPTSQDNFNALIKRLSHEVKVDSLKLNDETLYQIDPSPKQLIGLIKKGYFSEKVIMKKLR